MSPSKTSSEHNIGDTTFGSIIKMDTMPEDEQARQGSSTPKPHKLNTMPPNLSYPTSYDPLPKTPEPLHITPSSLPPNAPKESIPRFRIRRRRTNGPLAEQLHEHFATSDRPVPSIELSHEHQNSMEDMSRSTRPMDHTLLSPTITTPTAATPNTRFFSPPRTPVAQINTSFGPHGTHDRDQSCTPRLQQSNIERPSSVQSNLSDSSSSSASSTETSPSFGGSCTSPESDTTDPFIFPEAIRKPTGLASPVHFQTSSQPHKRVKTSHQVKWTPEMDEHLWKTYLAYQTNPEYTPFKALPGVAPPLGVCHRVAREAKKSWKGPRMALQPISENPAQLFDSIDSIMRETSAPPGQHGGADPPDTIRPASVLRSHSSTGFSCKPSGQWPRSETSTRKRLRVLCKSKPNLPPHYQRLMQTRSPSPFGSSSSGLRRSSRLSASPKGKGQKSSSFGTDDLKLSLTAHTMSSMQPGNALWQLASDPPVASSHQHYNTWSSSSTSRTAHHKTQSLPFGPSPSGRGKSSVPKAPLASPFQQPDGEDPFVNSVPSDLTVPEQSSSNTPALPRRKDAPWKIHAPRPMSGSMKRRAEYDLGDELFTSDVDNRRDFLKNLFRSDAAIAGDGHKRLRSRGFSLGAMRHASIEAQQQSSRQLTDLFTDPPPDEPAVAKGEVDVGSSVGNMVGMGRLAPPAPAYEQPRLGSPFAPAGNNGFSNTFPRSLFPQGLDSISNLEYQRQQPQLQKSVFGSDGANDDRMNNAPFGKNQSWQ